MNLPYSDFTPGTTRQTLFELAGMKLAASICYEDAYPAHDESGNPPVGCIGHRHQ